ncbi:MAG: hypothetical protein ABIP95_00435 [Pelobium sp.]
MKSNLIIIFIFLSILKGYSQQVYRDSSLIVSPKDFTTININSAPSTANKNRQNNDSTVIRICVPSRESLLSKPQPLWVIKYGNKEFRFKDNLLNSNPKIQLVQPEYIKSINVLKDFASLKTYGDDAAGGVVILTILENKTGDFKKHLKKFEKEIKNTTSN